MRNKPRVLVLEDDKWFADSLAKSIANGSDTDAKSIGDPELVFDIIDDWQPHVLVADLHLGSKNFMTLLNEMQSYRDTRLMPKIILSSSGHLLGEKEMASYGIVKIFDKSTYQLADLINCVRGLVCQPI